MSLRRMRRSRAIQVRPVQRAWSLQQRAAAWRGYSGQRTTARRVTPVRPVKAKGG
jgi:hypothetical protein